MQILTSFKWLLLTALLSSSALLSDVEMDWTSFEAPENWELTIATDCVDYFNFGNPLGKLSFRNGDKKVVYYAYEMEVLERIKRGAYSDFFEGKGCEEYGDWKIGSFPNFRYNGSFYLIDLCNTSGSFNVDASTTEYSDLSTSIHFYIDRE